MAIWSETAGLALEEHRKCTCWRSETALVTPTGEIRIRR